MGMITPQEIAEWAFKFEDVGLNFEKCFSKAKEISATTVYDMRTALEKVYYEERNEVPSN